MYERFSGQARRAMQLARREAQRFRPDYLGSEHLLLGVLQETSEIARLLQPFNLNPETLYRAVEATVTPGSESPDWEQLPLTPRVKRALEYAEEEATGLNHPHVGPEHLLLG